MGLFPQQFIDDLRPAAPAWAVIIDAGLRFCDGANVARDGGGEPAFDDEFAALMASRHVLGPEPDREEQIQVVRERWARLRRALSG